MDPSSIAEPSLDQPRKWPRYLTLIFLVGLAGTLGADAIPTVVDYATRYNIETIVDFDAIESGDSLGGGEYLVEKPIQDVGVPPLNLDTCDGRYEWAHAMGGVDAWATLSRVSVSAQPGHQVQVIGIKPVPLGPAESPKLGSLLTCGGKGGPPVRHVYMNLDTGAKAYYNGESQESYQEFNLAVPGGATEVIDIRTTTELHSWTYKVELTLVVDGKQIVKTINNGKPFTTTAATNAKHYRWVDNLWQEVTPGAVQQPELEAPKSSLPDACSLLTTKETSSILGKKLTEGLNFPSAPANSEAVGTVTSTMCMHQSDDLDMVQFSAVEAPPENVRREFEYELKMLGKGYEVQDVEGYKDVKNIGGSTILALKGNRILQITITRNGNEYDPLDAEYVLSLCQVLIKKI